MKYTLTLKNGYPFCPDTVELENEFIAVDNMILPAYIDKPNSFNPHNIKMQVIGHQFGPICAVWASCAQDALDQAVDLNMLDCALSEDQDYDNENLTPLGNASELFDLSDFWVADVELNPMRDIQLIVGLVRASENGHSTIQD